MNVQAGFVRRGLDILLQEDGDDLFFEGGQEARQLLDALVISHDPCDVGAGYAQLSTIQLEQKSGCRALSD